jgi:hypothetical protein
LTTTDSLIADLEAGLAAAKKLAAADLPDPPAPASAALDTSMMPGGADSAPVSAAVEPGVLSEAEAAAKPVFAEAEHAAETEGLDLIHELKEGKAVKEVAHLVDEAPDALESIVKAISDIAQGVRI